MKIIADTNVLVRALLDDDAIQTPAARRILRSAEQIIVSRHVFCEMAWVLGKTYKLPRVKVAAAIRGYLNSANVFTDTAAVEAGLEALEAGTDFADGVVAFEGRRFGGDIFVSFDEKAVATIAELGYRAELAV